MGWCGDGAIPVIKRAGPERADAYDREQTTDDTGSDREQRDSARGVYEGLVSATRVPRAKALWQRIHSTYGSTPADARATRRERVDRP